MPLNSSFWLGAKRSLYLAEQEVGFPPVTAG
jgi:hypothetical protein